jgi:hypothetical protein
VQDLVQGGKFRNLQNELIAFKKHRS